MLQKIVAAAVYGLLRHKMAAVLAQGFQGIGNGRRAGRKGQSRRPSLQGRHPFLQYVLGGVCKPAVNIAGVSQAKPGCRVFAAVEYIGGGGIDGHGPGVGGRVRPLLANMELQSFEFVFRHSFPSFPAFTYLFDRWNYSTFHLLCQ